MREPARRSRMPGGNRPSPRPADPPAAEDGRPLCASPRPWTRRRESLGVESVEKSKLIVSRQERLFDKKPDRMRPLRERSYNKPRVVAAFCERLLVAASAK